MMSNSENSVQNDIRERRIHDLDLEPIKFKLVMDQDGPRWSRERANLAEDSYKQFLTLIVRYPEERIVPLGDIDAIWHQHILDTVKYAEDCKLVFGRFLHHFPYYGLRGENDADALQCAGQKTKKLFSEEFGSSAPVLTANDGALAACDNSPEPGPPSCAPEPSCANEPDPKVFGQRPRFETGLHMKLM